jgi:hypothetical protein
MKNEDLLNSALYKYLHLLSQSLQRSQSFFDFSLRPPAGAQALALWAGGCGLCERLNGPS